MKNSRKILAIPVLLTILLFFTLIVILIYSGKGNFYGPSISSSSKLIVPKEINPSPTPRVDVKIDYTNDGTYSDERHGFTFDYPQNLFKFQNNHDTGAVWSNQEFDDSEGKSRSSRLFLSASAQKIGSGYINNIYNEAQKLKVGQSTQIQFWVVTKIDTKIINEKSVDILYYGSIPYAEVDSTHAYIALWRDGEENVYVMMSTESIQELDSYKDIFEKIILSLDVSKV